MVVLTPTMTADDPSSLFDLDGAQRIDDPGVLLSWPALMPRLPVDLD